MKQSKLKKIKKSLWREYVSCGGNFAELNGIEPEFRELALIGASFDAGVEVVQKELDEAVEVIRFYADINNWTGEDCNGWNSTNVIHESDQDERLTAVWIKGGDNQEDEYDNVGGKRAREFLAKVKRG
jgi:hypothetical protein